MRKFTLSLLVILLSVFVMAQDCEDFDSYNVGDYVAVNIPGWTTWSGSGAGTAEDATISDDYSYSPSNSIVIEGTTDLVQLFADENITSGKWYYSNMLYIPDGHTGYFNLQADVTPGLFFGFQIEFNPDGSAYVDAGAENAVIFSFDFDTWLMNEVIVDLDADYAEYWYNGELMVAWAWSAGTFGTATPLTLGGVDYYALATDPQYFDDICFYEYVEPADCEDFDALTAGGYVAEQLGGYWTTWGGTPGGADDAMVSDTYSNSPDNSFVVDDGSVDLVFQFGDEAITSGQWMYSHYIYVPSGNSGYFNVQTDPTPGVDWNLDVFFDDGGVGELGTQSTETFTYMQDTWVFFQVNYDFDAGLAEVWIDGEMIAQFVNEFAIGGIDYYGLNSGGPPGAYYDDVCFGVGYEIGTLDCENFDALTAGDYVAGQLGGYWTTWGGTPGGADDAMVSDMYSNSPDNSFVVDNGSVDLVFQFGDEAITSGQWMYSHYIYVPTGNSGYFNVQTDPTPGVDWNLDVFFDDGGVGELGTQSTETFTYMQDTWVLFQVNYDFDAGLAEVWIDGEMIAQFVNEYSIGGIDYYGLNSGGPPGAYYDDVCFGEGYMIETLDCENFDALTAGDYVAGQLGGYWTTWGGTPGGSDDAMVSDMYSNSPSNSFVVDNGSVDLVFQFGDDPISEGQWMYTHYIYVPTGNSGYFNVQAEPTPGVDWNLDVYFDDGGVGELGTQSTETFTYAQDTWILFEVNYDFTSGLAEVKIDGTSIDVFENIFTIGGIDYYGLNTGGPPGAYYDDVCFGEGYEIPVGIEEPSLESNAVIFPNPARDQITIQSENIIDEVMIYNNMGQLVYTGEFNNDQITVNTSNFITGMYVVQVRSGKAIEVRKLIIE